MTSTIPDVGSISQAYGSEYLSDDTSANFGTGALRLNPNANLGGFTIFAGSANLNIVGTPSAGNVNLTIGQVGAAANTITFYGNTAGGSPFNVPVFAGAAKVITSTATGNIIGNSSLPVTLGGTGLTAVIPNNTLLGSDGTGYISVAAGTGIVISGGTISANVSGNITTSNVNYSVANSTGTPFILNLPSNIDAQTTVINYIANTTATQTVATLVPVANTAVTVSLLSGRRNAAGTTAGSGQQQFNIKNNAGTTTVTQFGTASGTAGGTSSVVTVTPAGTNVALGINLTAGDQWKAYVTMVVMP
jgi:hypothetical protein